MMNKTVLTIMLGLIAGLFGGSLGQSGAEFMLPGLLVLGIVANHKTAIGTVLLTIVPPLSLGAVYVYYKRNQVDVKTALILMVSYFITAYLGAKYSKNVSDETIGYITGFYLISIGLFMIWNAHTKRF